MKPASEQWNVFDHSGPRLQFLAIVNDYRPEGIHLIEYCQDIYFDYDGDDYENWDSDWGKAGVLWNGIKDCCKKAAALIALQPTFERADRVHKQHLDGMVPLLLELKQQMIKCGLQFAQADDLPRAPDGDAGKQIEGAITPPTGTRANVCHLQRLLPGNIGE